MNTHVKWSPWGRHAWEEAVTGTEVCKPDGFSAEEYRGQVGYFGRGSAIYGPFRADCYRMCYRGKAFLEFI